MIRVDDLHKDFGSAMGAVNGLSLDIGEGAFFSLVGPSGCGKTTALRCIAGLEQPTTGEIQISGTTVFSSAGKVNVPPHRREVGMVFQSYAIWPHMTVAKNIAYPLKNRRWSRSDIADAVSWAVDLVGLKGKADRPAPLLSGGEQQRVALARALVEQPKVLLLDEPLSNLDAKLREQMRFELRELQQRIGFTALYVTHDQDEAFALSDEMAVMQSGQLMELGDPATLYRTPSTTFGAEFLGAATRVTGHVVSSADDAETTVETAMGRLQCRMSEAPVSGTQVQVFVRPEDVDILGPDVPATGAVVEGRLERVVPLGGLIEWWVEISGIQVRGRSLANEVATSLLIGNVGGAVRLHVATSVAISEVQSKPDGADSAVTYDGQHNTVRSS